MNEIEFLKDTLEHKKLILDIGLKVVDYLEKHGRSKQACYLSKRLIIHDDSKIKKEETSCFSRINNSDGMRDPNLGIPDEIKDMIKVHWRNNRHHPEHFIDYHDMSEVDVIEMVCDWFSRSKQYGTDFLEFVNTRQANRFHFDDEFYEMVMKYCNLLIELDKE